MSEAEWVARLGEIAAESRLVRVVSQEGGYLSFGGGISRASLYRSALGNYNSSLTYAGRALTKHPEVVGLTKQTLRQIYRTDPAINEAAANSLKDMLRQGVGTTQTLPRYGSVIQYQISDGFGARWYGAGSNAGEFIGFIGP